MFKIIGAAGLVLISVGIISRQRRRQDVLYMIGGIFLEVYSIHLKDVIFIILQIVFTVSAIYDFIKTFRPIKVIAKPK